MTLFYFLIALNVGLFKFPSGGWITVLGDLLNLLFFIFSLVKYSKERKILLRPPFSILEKLWLVFLLYFTISAINSPSLLRLGAIANLRLVYPFLLFFSCVAFLTDQKRIYVFLQVLVFYAIIGGIISIIQSFYGIIPMFDIHGFYNIGHWEGQQSYITPGLARVMLPPIYLIYAIFISLLLNRLILNDHRYSFLLVFFCVPILIGFARSHWFALFLTTLATTFVFARGKTFNLRRIFKILFFLIITSIIAFIVLKNTLGDTFTSAITERFIRTFSDIEQGQGTFGSRLFTIGLSLKLWLKNPLWGNGAAYASMERMGNLSDVGFTYVLATIGLVGLILIIILYISIVVFSYKIIMIGIANKNKDMVFAGSISFSIPIFLVICQQFSQYPYVYVLLALGNGYCAAQFKIYLQNNFRLSKLGENISS